MIKKITFVLFIIFVFALFSCVSQKQGYTKEESRIIENIEKGNTEEAFEIIKEEYQKDPEDERLREMYSSALLSLGRIDEAKAVLEKEESPESLYKMALIDLSEGQSYAALEKLYKAIKKDPGHSESLSVLGEIYLRQKKYDKAESYFLKSLKADANNLSANMGMGSLLARKDELKKAIMFYSKAQILAPDHFLVYADRAKVRAADSDLIGAEEDFTKAIKLNPDYYWNYIDRGRMYLLKKGDMEAALKDFNTAISMKPDYYYPYIFRASIYNNKAMLDESIADFEFVVQKNPSYYFAYEFLAINYFIKKNWESASANFLKGFEHQKEEYSYLVLSAICALKSGNKLGKEIKNKLLETPKDSPFYDSSRLFYDNSYDNMASVTADSEENPDLKAKFIYYLAEYYLINNKKYASENLISEFLKLDRQQLLEYKLMKLEFQHLLK